MRPFGSDRPRNGHAQGAVYCSPRSILRGPKTWYVASHKTREAVLLQKALTQDKVRRKHAALEFSEDAESALQARMPGERVMISVFKM
jgi:hypothetical protein